MTRPIHTATARALAQSSAGRALPTLRAEMARLNEQLATGLRVNRASDDPTAFAQGRLLRHLEERLGQYERSIGAARSWVDQTQGALTAAGDLFAQAQEIGVRGANGVLDREAFALQIESLRAELVTTLNATSDGEYLFAGNETSTAPLTADGTVAAGDFSGARSRQVAPHIALTVNIPGTDALFVGGTPAPDRLQALADALRTGGPTDIAAALDDVEAASQHYVRLTSQSGDTARRLDAASDAVAAHAISTAARRSDLEDVDLASLLGELQRRQTGLEAALRVAASAEQTSLMDYLR